MCTMTPSHMWVSWNCPGLHYTAMTSSIWKPESHIPSATSQWLWSFVFSFLSPRLIILAPYARSGSLTLLNMCQTLFMRVKLFKRPIYRRRKPSPALTPNAVWHAEAHKAECSGRCGRQRGPSEPSSVTLDQTQESIYLRRGEGTAAILIFPVSPRGGEWRRGEEQDGDISTALQCIMKKGLI